MELIELLKRISSNATNIARIFLETKKDKEASIKKEIKNLDQKRKLLKNKKANDKLVLTNSAKSISLFSAIFVSRILANSEA